MPRDATHRNLKPVRSALHRNERQPRRHEHLCRGGEPIGQAAPTQFQEYVKRGQPRPGADGQTHINPVAPVLRPQNSRKQPHGKCQRVQDQHHEPELPGFSQQRCRDVEPVQDGFDERKAKAEDQRGLNCQHGQGQIEPAVPLPLIAFVNRFHQQASERTAHAEVQQEQIAQRLGNKRPKAKSVIVEKMQRQRDGDQLRHHEAPHLNIGSRSRQDGVAQTHENSCQLCQTAVRRQVRTPICRAGMPP